MFQRLAKITKDSSTISNTRIVLYIEDNFYIKLYKDLILIDENLSSFNKIIYFLPKTRQEYEKLLLEAQNKFPLDNKVINNLEIFLQNIPKDWDSRNYTKLIIPDGWHRLKEGLKVKFIKMNPNNTAIIKPI
jgi:hypothetical protein